jgi:2',3'-cyclic-nucleotide 2'-phosphodiesterase (5'-nucleotidase family)
MQYGQVVLVDNGGYFPEQDNYQDVAWFLMDAMKMLGVDAIGVGDRDLRYGLSFLKARAKADHLPIVCANLLDRNTRRPVVDPFVVKKVGTVTIGFTGLLSDKVDLGPSRDSLAIQEPSAAARAVIPAMRKKGATVLVLLSQLGKVESEDLVSAVEGFDAVIVGRNVPVLQKGRLIRSTVACYGGEQGQYIGRTILTLDPKRKVTTGDNETFVLSPEVGEKPEVAQTVKLFEDSWNEKVRKIEKEAAARQAAKEMEKSPDKYVGAEVCSRCHVQQTEQWKNTTHARAWKTLVDGHKDTSADCIPCHVVGYRQPGGFTSAVDTPSMANVQCENCHGMGTQHDAFAKEKRKVTEAVCVTCHQGDNDPTFNFAAKLAKVVH